MDLDPRPLRQALAQAPEAAAGWLQLGLVLGAGGAVAEAAWRLRRATALAPRNAAAWEGLATAEETLGRWDQAAEAWTRAVMLRPGRAESHLHLARVLARADDPDAADRAFATVSRLMPGDPDLVRERAQTWADAGQRLGRADAYRRALALDPGLAPVWVNQGGRDWGTEGGGRAADFWRRAVALAPDLADAHNNVGIAEHRVGRLPAAARAYRRALTMEPARSDAWFNLGSAEHSQGRVEPAVAAYERAVALRPGFLDALLPLATLTDFLGLLDRATAVNRAIVALRPDQPDASRALLAALIFDPALDGGAIRRIREDWCARWLPAARLPRFAGVRDPDRTIRIGVVGGPNLRGNTHAFVALPGFEGLDRRAHGLEVVVYSDLPEDHEDGYSRRYRLSSDEWRPTERLDDAALADLVRRDRIDVLVDVVGHLGGPRFPAVAARPAPVQVMDLALGTSGSTAAQWIIGDPLLIPPEHKAHFTERVLRLPLAYCYDPLLDLPAVGRLPATTSGHVTFGSTNALVKVTPATIALWARVLRAVPGSRLVVKGRGFAENRVRAHFAGAFDRHGIAASRVDLRPWTSGFVDHLEFQNEIDIALDPIPYGGVTTTCEALWMGVPVITLAGDRMAGRYGLALLSAVGFRQGIAASQGDYVARAAALAADIDTLALLRTSLRSMAQASPLADRKAYGRARGAAFRAAWREWCAES